ncbi:MAG: enoyl-CoA hydratase/isomerase family protein [Chloroflexi bacterium]|nr:enoyl-CoA hydratase/isomerase family protein [Chloroflexota bacterium]
MERSTILYEKKDHIAYVTLNRPERLNAFNMPMMQELERAWRDFGEDREARVAIVTGSGKAFCAGLDLKEAAVGERDVAATMKITARRSGVFKPVICAINGACVGGGFHFVLDSDIQICSEEATFLDAHTSVGYVSHRELIALSRRIGYSAALRIGLMGRYELLSAQQALGLGIVSEVVAQERLLPRATELAETIKQNAPLALEGTIEAMWRSLNLGVEDAIALSAQIARRNFMTEDAREGPRAFAEKRQPRWKGR